jgi:hypothetical protein
MPFKVNLRRVTVVQCWRLGAKLDKEIVTPNEKQSSIQRSALG